MAMARWINQTQVVLVNGRSKVPKLAVGDADNHRAPGKASYKAAGTLHMPVSFGHGPCHGPEPLTKFSQPMFGIFATNSKV